MIYTDNDPFVCAWMRNLVAAGHLPSGEVWERDIRDITAEECEPTMHFFAGIGGWPLAMELAEWFGPVWTASCPCQPFSIAGRQGGEQDERHLWPTLFTLIRECAPPVVFGEQVASPDGYEWLARVRDDLEGAGYAVGAADLPACCVGAPHIRNRLFWVAHAERDVAERHGQPVAGASLGVPEEGVQREWLWPDAVDGGDDGAGLGDANGAGPQGHRQHVPRPGPEGADQRLARAAGSWGGAELVKCREPDGRIVYRRAEPGAFPLAHGIPGRVGRVRGYGNAIVPQVAALFVEACRAAGVQMGSPWSAGAADAR